MSELKVMYGGIAIEYDERADVWRFELRGRERSAESLTNAKAAIDKPEREKSKPFERIKAYFLNGYGDSSSYAVVDVTSIAETCYGNGSYVWVQNGKSRSKEPAYRLFAHTTENAEIINEITDLVAAAKKIDERIRDAQNRMKKIELPDSAGR